MTLHKILTTHYNTDEKLKSLAVELGYANPKKGLFMLQRFIKEKSLLGWLSSGVQYDFKYDTTGFVNALASVLKVDIDQNLKEANRYIGMQRKLESAYIEVDTNFSRKGESLLLLMGMSKLRIIHFDKSGLVGKSDETIFKAVQKTIQEHYQKTQGVLPLWGEIEKYIYYHIDECKYILDCEGNVMNIVK